MSKTDMYGKGFEALLVGGKIDLNKVEESYSKLNNCSSDTNVPLAEKVEKVVEASRRNYCDSACQIKDSCYLFILYSNKNRKIHSDHNTLEPIARIHEEHAKRSSGKKAISYLQINKNCPNTNECQSIWTDKIGLSENKVEDENIDQSSENLLDDILDHFAAPWARVIKDFHDKGFDIDYLV